MKILTAIFLIKNKMKGSLKVAKEKGMVVESGVSVMGRVDFGSEPYLITLKTKCRISYDVTFINHDGGTWAFRNHMKEYKDVIKYGRIEVGEESFIGARSIIMPGVKIGRNCVIGAGSVVTKDVDDETVVAGIPAKKICTLKEYAEKCVVSMPTNFDKKLYSENKKDYLVNIL